MANPTFETALAAIIAAFIIIWFILPACNHILVTKDSMAFEDMNRAIKKMGTLTKYHATINLYDDQFLVGFPQDSEKITMQGQDTYIERPKNCPLDRSCICFCKDTKYDLDDLDEGEIKCPAYMCQDYEAEFNSVIGNYDFFGSAYSDVGDEIGEMSGGFFLFKRYNDLYLMQPLDVKIYKIDEGMYFSLNPDYNPRDNLVSGRKGGKDE